MPTYNNKNDLYLSLAVAAFGLAFFALAFDAHTMGLIWAIVHSS